MTMPRLENRTVIVMLVGKVSHDARRGNDRQGLPPKHCQQCGKLGHAARDCQSGGPRISNAEGHKTTNVNKHNERTTVRYNVLIVSRRGTTLQIALIMIVYSVGE